MRARGLLTALLLLGAPAGAQSPLSAIDWLSDTIASPERRAPAAVKAVPPPRQFPDDIALNALPQPVTVQRLGAPQPDRVGLLPAMRAGLPDDLWRGSTSGDIARRLAQDRGDALPALRDLLRTMLQVAAEPPADSGPDAVLFYARIDALLAMGDVATARSLLDRADREAPRNFRRWFDITLLTGQENLACARMRALPDITPTYAARVFCLARGGDWATAALTLDTARALSLLDPAEDALLAAFLDDGGEGHADLVPPRRPTPLQVALYEAIGTPVATTGLPVAFAHGDLRAVIGWKSQIEAAERLARAGAIPPATLWAVYGRRAPAASGGSWDRVAAVQAFDAAIAAESATDVAALLPETWQRMQDAGLALPLARHYGPALSRLDLMQPGLPNGPEMRAIAAQIAVLSPTPGRVLDTPLGAALPPFLAGLARGAPDTALAQSDLEKAIADGFAAESSPADATATDDACCGLTLLRAMDAMAVGEAGNYDALRDGLAALRAAGQNATARDAALQLLILDRRG